LSFHQATPRTGSLVVYKSRPARVLATADKIEIEIEGGQTKRVRPKDVLPLHPGPVTSLSNLRPSEVDPQEAWELLEGAESDLKELAELLYGEHTPGAAWGAWEWLSEGLWFEGTTAVLRPRAAEAIERDRAEREAKAAAATGNRSTTPIRFGLARRRRTAQYRFQASRSPLMQRLMWGASRIGSI
jgi:exoribonuclease-2